MNVKAKQRGLKGLKGLMTVGVIWFMGQDRTLGALLAYESYAYSGTTVTAGGAGSGFSGNWQTVTKPAGGNYLTGNLNAASILNGTSPYPVGTDYVFDSSNAGSASLPGTSYTGMVNGRALSTSVNMDVAGTYYLSYALRITPFSGTNSDSTLSIGLASGLTSSDIAFTTGYGYGDRVRTAFGQANRMNYDSLITQSDGLALPAFPSVGSFYFVLAEITTSGTGNDLIKTAFFDKNDTLPLSAAGVTWDLTTSANLTGQYTHLITQAEGSNADSVVWDEIRLANSYSAATGVPEASSAVMMAIGGLGLALRRRRHTR